MIFRKQIPYNGLPVAEHEKTGLVGFVRRALAFQRCSMKSRRHRPSSEARSPQQFCVSYFCSHSSCARGTHERSSLSRPSVGLGLQRGKVVGTLKLSARARGMDRQGMEKAPDKKSFINYTTSGRRRPHNQRLSPLPHHRSQSRRVQCQPRCWWLWHEGPVTDRCNFSNIVRTVSLYTERAINSMLIRDRVTSRREMLR